MADDADTARDLARGVLRLLAAMGFEGVAELTLPGGRRADVVGLDKAGGVVAVEIKTSLADFRADAKWPEYLDHCEAFYFAVPENFPVDVLPDDHGILIADRFGADILRPAPVRKIAPARKRAVALRLARAAAQRLRALDAPDAGV